MFKRKHLIKLKTRVNEPRRFIQTLIGPRQVGKTTLIKQLVKEIDFPFIYISADDEKFANSLWIEQQWEAARMKLKLSNSEAILLVIDEIQKIKEWSSTVKLLWDSDSFNDINIKVILLGSAGLTLQKGLNESLAGRYEIINVNHWNYEEMSSAFNFSPEQFVWFGGYPGAATLIDDEIRWKDYVRNSLIEATISKDILTQTRVDKPALLKALFEIGCSYSGQILSFSKIVGQLQDAGNTTTLSHYLDLLNTAGLLSGIEKYYIEKHRQKSSSPKFQVKNTAYLSALTNTTFTDIFDNLTVWGRHVESAIGAHLLNYSITENYKLHYWRHKNDEVDFVLDDGNKIIGLEIKSGATTKYSGINAFKKQFNPHKTFLVGNSGILWQDFLKINPIELF